MLKFLIKRIQEKRATKIARLLLGHLNKGETVLDFGCGDGLVSEGLANNGINISLVDVIDANMSSLESIVYDGKKLPFPKKSFDTTMAIYVLHHTEDPKKAIDDLLRVAKKRIIIAEDVYKYKLQRPLLRFFDSFNALIDPTMPLTYHFKTEEEWVSMFESMGLEVEYKGPMNKEFFDPIAHTLFVLRVKESAAAKVGA